MEDIARTSTKFIPNDHDQEPHDEYVIHDRKKYLYKKELGRGSFGIVYLYEEKDS